MLRCLICLLLLLTVTTASHCAVVSQTLDWIPCPNQASPNKSCADIQVPFFWETPNAVNNSMITLHIESILANSTMRKGSWFFISGGPGFSTVLQFRSLMSLFFETVGNREYDIILMDSRGTGDSTFLGCQSWPNIPLCIEEVLQTYPFLHNATENLSGFSTIQSAQDFVHVMKLMNEWYFTNWNIRSDSPNMILYGWSYGSFLVNQILKIEPNLIKSSIIDGPCPPGINFIRASDSVNETGTIFINECKQDRNCSKHFESFGGIDQVFNEVIQGVSNRKSNNACYQLVNFCYLNHLHMNFISNFYSIYNNRLLLFPLYLRLRRCSIDDQNWIKNFTTYEKSDPTFRENCQSSTSNQITQFNDLNYYKNTMGMGKRQTGSNFLSPLIITLFTLSELSDISSYTESEWKKEYTMDRFPPLQSDASYLWFLTIDLVKSYIPKTPENLRTFPNTVKGSMLVFEGSIDGNTPFSYFKRWMDNYSQKVSHSKNLESIVYKNIAHSTIFFTGLDPNNLWSQNTCTVQLMAQLRKQNFELPLLDKSCVDQVVYSKIDWNNPTNDLEENGFSYPLFGEYQNESKVGDYIIILVFLMVCFGIVIIIGGIIGVKYVRRNHKKQKESIRLNDYSSDNDNM